MGKRLIILTCVLATALGAVMMGCDDTNEQARSVVSVSSMNNNSPFLSDVVGVDTTTTPNTIYFVEDIVPVMFFNKPYNNLVSTRPGDPHGDFLITRYTVTWTRTDGGTGTLPDYEGATSILVPSDEFVEGFITLVTFANKGTALITPLQGGGEITMRADIRFYGHEVGIDRETAVDASISVSFVNLADDPN